MHAKYGLCNVSKRKREGNLVFERNEMKNRRKMSMLEKKREMSDYKLKMKSFVKVKDENLPVLKGVMSTSFGSPGTRTLLYILLN